MTTHRSALGLHEEPIDSELVLDGVLLKVRRDRVRLPDGQQSTREYIVHPGAAVIVPHLPGGKLLLERQYRHAHRREFIEFPAGKLEPDETMLACAQRELLEETGYRAARWESLAVVHPAVTYTSEKLEIFLADELEYVGQQLDDGEFVDTFEASLDEALGWIERGEVTDAKTVIGILLFANRRR